MQQIFAAANSNRSASQRGVILLDLVIAVALLSLLILMVMPTLPRQTTASRLGAYAAEVAAVLRADRTASARAGREVATTIDIPARMLSGGGSPRKVSLPNDVTLDFVASDSCRTASGEAAVVFAPDGRSCGAVITLLSGRLAWRIRVNWLTGFIDVVPPDRQG
jgi:general secretion pathway protein H